MNWLSPQEKMRKIDFQDGGHSSCPGFSKETIVAMFDIKVARYFLPSFKFISLSVQLKKRKKECKEGRQLGF